MRPDHQGMKTGKEGHPDETNSLGTEIQQLNTERWYAEGGFRNLTETGTEIGKMSRESKHKKEELHVPNAGGLGSIPGQGPKIPHAVQCGKSN